MSAHPEQMPYGGPDHREREDVGSGPWSITDWPDGWPEDAKAAAAECVNASIPEGCCGGCV